MTPPTTVSPPRPEVVTEGIPRRRAAWIERATSTDHKSVGILYLGTSLCFGALAAVELVLMRVQLIVPENTAIHPEIFDRVLSAFGVTAVILFAIPLALGLIGYIAPLQIGSRGVAFPRLGLLSFWLYAGRGGDGLRQLPVEARRHGSRGVAAAVRADLLGRRRR